MSDAITRRTFIAGTAAISVVPYLPAMDDMMVRCVVYQSWPFDEPMPETNWFVGSIGIDIVRGTLQPLSSLLPRIRELQQFEQRQIWWKPLLPQTKD